MTAPYSNNDTSKLAAELIEPHLGHLESIVYAAICDAEWSGATCDELEDACGLSHQCASARVNALKEKGLIVDVGVRRPTRSGRSAICWRKNLEEPQPTLPL